MRKSPKNAMNEIIEKTSNHPSIKVQLDYKTFITIWDVASLKVWRKRYPNAHVLSA